MLVAVHPILEEHLSIAQILVYLKSIQRVPVSSYMHESWNHHVNSRSLENTPVHPKDIHTTTNIIPWHLLKQNIRSAQYPWLKALIRKWYVSHRINSYQIALAYGCAWSDRASILLAVLYASTKAPSQNPNTRLMSRSVERVSAIKLKRKI